MPRKDQRSVFGNGVPTPIKSNRKQPGVAGRRREIPAWEGKRIAEHLRAERVHFPNDTDYWRAMMIHYRPLTKESHQNVVRKEDMYAQRLKDNKKGNAGGIMSWGTNSVKKHKYKGCRAAGGGRKDRCLELKQHVKAWCEVERSYGHTLTLNDLYLEFKHVAIQQAQRLTNALADCREVEAVVAGTIIQGTSGMKSRLVELKSRLAKLEASAAYCKTFKKRLQISCHMKLRKAQRLVDISPNEERARCQ